MAIWFYGRPAFAEQMVRATRQPVMDEIFNRRFAGVVKGGGEEKGRTWKRATDCMASWLDCVELKRGVWRDVEKVKWNGELKMPFYGPAACGFEVEVVNRVDLGREKVDEVEDWGLWGEEWHSEGIKRFVTVNVPALGEERDDEDVERLYKSLDLQMGGKGVKRAITWPLVLILATRE